MGPLLQRLCLLLDQLQKWINRMFRIKMKLSLTFLSALITFKPFLTFLITIIDHIKVVEELKS